MKRQQHKWIWLMALAGSLGAPSIWASQPGSEDLSPQSDSPNVKAPSKEVRYKKGKDIDFEALVIQGQFQRPELSVVTGDVSQGTDGLLKLRENFIDRMSADLGEGAP